MTNNESASLGRKSPTIFYALAAFIAPIILYAHAVRYFFIYDDSELVVNKAPPTSVDGWLTLLTSPYYQGLPYYRPIPSLLFALERTAFGLNPAPYHATNIVCVSILSFVLFYTLLRSPFSVEKKSAIAISLACVFHPATSSTVYAISGREALLAALCTTAAFSSYFAARFSMGWRSAIFVLGALLCRESSVFLIPVFAGSAAIQYRSKPPPVLVRDLFWLALPFMAYLALRSFALSASASSPELTDSFLSIPLSYLYMLSSILTPTVSLQYEPEIPEWLTGSRMALALVAVLAIVNLLRLVQFARKPVIAGSIAVSLLSFTPTANIFLQETPFDERHLLTPLIALLIAIFLAIRSAQIQFSAYLGRLSGVPVPIAAALIFGAISFSRGAVFASDDLFFDNWLKSASDRSKVINHAAAKALAEGDVPRALELANRSIDLRGSTPGFLYRGRIKSVLGDLSGARADINSTLELDSEQSAAWCTLGIINLKSGDSVEAERDFAKALSVNSNSWCAPTGTPAPPFWGAGLTGAQLKMVPISSREEARFYQEAHAIRAGT